MTRQTNQGRTPISKIVAVTLLVALLGTTGGNISAHLASLSEKKGPLFVIVAVDNEVLVRRSGCDNPVEAFIGMQLACGDQLQTGPFGTVELKGDHGETILVESNTSLEVSDNAIAVNRERCIRLNAGRIWVGVVKLTRALRNMFRFSIITPTAFAGVRGTTFSVAVEDDLTTEVSVFDGVVEVIAAQNRVKVVAGYTTRVRPGREPEEPKGHNEDQGRAWEKHRQRFEQKPGKLPPPFQKDWQPPGLVGKDKDNPSDEPGKGQENLPDNHVPKGKDNPGHKPKKSKELPSEKNRSPKVKGPKGPKGDGKDG
jgi:hypothetical protein